MENRETKLELVERFALLLALMNGYYEEHRQIDGIKRQEKTYWTKKYNENAWNFMVKKYEISYPGHSQLFAITIQWVCSNKTRKEINEHKKSK